MVLSSHRSLIAAIVLAISFKSAMAINCYQCSGTDPENPFICNEFLNSGEELELKSCDNVYGANYCVKHTGRFEGNVTKFNPESIPALNNNKITSVDGFNLLTNTLHQNYVKTDLDVQNDTNTITHLISFCIKCYQCDSTKSIDCADVLINEDGNTFQPENCDNVFEAQYCVKSTGLRGGIGTRRFCSGLDLGNYCNYVQNKGDQLEYRSCIFTCGTDGCNASSSIAPIKFVLMPSILIAVFMKRLTT